MTNLERQKSLYDFLVDMGSFNIGYLSQEELAKAIYNQYDIQDYLDFNYMGKINRNKLAYHDTTARKILTNDIREINSNPDFEKIIISNGNGVKIAIEEDYDKMIKSLYRAVFAKLKRIKTIEKKAKRNGQITIDKKEIVAFLEENNVSYK